MSISDLLVVGGLATGAAIGTELVNRALRTGGIDPLAFDLYSHDHGLVDLAIAARDPRFIGGWLKTGQGLYYDGSAWFVPQWANALEAGKARAWPWQEWRRGAYHYLTNQDGRAQGEAFVRIVERAGGLVATDFAPMVDIEHESNFYAFADASKQQIVDAYNGFRAVVRAELGRDVVPYVATSLLSEKGVTARDLDAATGIVVTGGYAAKLDHSTYLRLGYTRRDLLGWQYTGVDSSGRAEGKLAGYPLGIDGIGNVDIIALQRPGRECLGELALGGLVA